MGKLTCVVMVGFLAIHVAVILDIVAISTPDWLKLEYNTTVSPQKDNLTYHKGLWEYCIEDNCTALNQTMQTTAFRSVQALSVVGTGMMVLALILVYSFLLNNRCRDSQGFSSINVVLQLISFGALLVSVIIFGMKSKVHSEEFIELLPQLSWSYWVSVAGCIAGAISCFMAFQECRSGAFRRREYENI